MSDPNPQTTSRKVLKWVGMTVGIVGLLGTLFVEMAFLVQAADNYKASIVREIVASLKEANNAQ